MSATLSLTPFLSNEQLFPAAPPVMNIPGRQHPVTVHFARKTVLDYADEAVKKVVKIHKRLPPGGILVFMTGQKEIETVVKKLEKLRSAQVDQKSRRRGLPKEEAQTLSRDRLGEGPYNWRRILRLINASKFQWMLKWKILS